MGLFRGSLDYTIRNINPYGINILKYPDKQKLIGVKLTELLDDSSVLDEADYELAQLAQSPVLNNMSVQLRCYDGTVIWVHITARYVNSEIEGGLYIGGSIEDITAYRESQEALKQANENLELQVDQRTQQLVELNRRLEKLSALDGLTGISNRRSFDTFLEQQWAICGRQKVPLSMMILDIDFFKNYNDYYGHQAGDECIKKIAHELDVLCKRASDMVARYGGEEFVVVLPATSIQETMKMAEYFRLKIKELKIEHMKSDVDQYVTVSIGVASVVPQQDTSFSEIIAAADKALYKAKSNGRNRVCH